MKPNPYVAVASITKLLAAAIAATVVRCFATVSFVVSCFHRFVGGTIEIIIEWLVG